MSHFARVGIFNSGLSMTHFGLTLKPQVNGQHGIADQEYNEPATVKCVYTNQYWGGGGGGAIIFPQYLRNDLS